MEKQKVDVFIRVHPPINPTDKICRYSLTYHGRSKRMKRDNSPASRIKRALDDEKNQLTMLNDVYPQASFHNTRVYFVTQLDVIQHTFTGVGASKKLAKGDAVQSAFAMLHPDMFPSGESALSL